jgi:hypothetical protein
VVDYHGSVPFGSCAVLKGFTDRANYAGPYCTSSLVRHSVTYTGATIYMDAGVGNQDDYSRALYGCATDYVWEVYPC